MVKRLIATVVAIAAGVVVSNVDVWAAVGRTPGQFAVTPTGASQYSIPIWAPPGPHGMEPHIALTYNSHQGNGYVGVGWGLSGLSSIYRCNHTYAQDGSPAPVALATSDGYCMDGQRLRLTAGTYGTPNSTYQTEIANFMNVEAYNSAGNGPGYWQATDRNGWQYTYGAGGTTSNAQVLASGSSSALSWQLNQVKDPQGNTMTITYLTSNVTGVVVPQTISWAPSSAGSSSYLYTMTFSYGSTGSVHGYVGGTPFNNTNLLASISVAYEGTAVKTYYLNYSNTTTATSRYLLAEIQECAGTGTSNCLLPTNLTWQPGSAGVGSGAAISGTAIINNEENVGTTAYDLSGDGSNDLVMTTSGGAVLVAFGSSGGYGTPVNTGITNVNGLAVGDIDGSGQASLVTAASGIWYYYKWNGSTFVSTPTGASATGNSALLLADVDGDGRADLVYTGSNGTTHVRLNNSTNGTVSFAPDIDTGIAFSFNLRGQVGGSNRAMHFWGSSQADLLGTNRTCTQYKPNTNICQAYEYNYFAAHFTGTTFTLLALENGISQMPVVDIADYNDDGCTDVLTQTQLFLSNCNGNTSTPVALPSGVTALGGMDWNGDGRRDVLVAQTSGYVGVVLSTGTGLSATTINTSYATSVGYTAAPNLTGDGQDGLIAYNGSSTTYYTHNSFDAPPDLLTSITDGFGNSVSVNYASISQPNIAYNPWNDQVFPYINWMGPYYVAYKATFSDPSSAVGATYYQQFWYAGATMNAQGRGFAGFGAQQRYDSRSGIWETWDYGRTFPYSGMLNIDIAAQDYANTKPIYSQTNNLTSLTLSTTANEQRYFPYANTNSVSRYEVGGSKNATLITSTVTNYGTPDNYGNFTNVTSTVTDNDSGSPYSGNTWTTTTVSTIAPNTSSWCLSLATEIQVTKNSSAPGGAAITRTTNYTPDYSNCRETQQVTASGTAYQVTEAYTFDGFGNISSDTVTGAGMAARSTSINWGTSGQFPTVVTNALGQSITMGYNLANGTKTSQTDPNYTSGNPIATTWTYDAFARLTQENRPDGTSSAWSYNDCSSYGGCLFGSHALAKSYYIYASGNALQNDGTTYYDTVDRPVMSNAETLSGYNRNEVRYDSLGRVAKQAIPCTFSAVATPCSYWTTFSYDMINRVTQSQRPISASNSTLQTTGYGYAGRTNTIADALGNTTTQIHLVTGALARSQDAKGYYQSFTYDAFGSLTSVVDSASTALFSATYAYGIKAFQTSSTDMDLGARSYTVDPLGEVTAYSDAKGQNFTQSYDLLSRPVTRTDLVAAPDLVTTWTWGSSAASYNIGKLQSVTAAGSNGTYAETYSYDNLTRLRTDSISIPSESTYTYIYSYDASTGLLSNLTYPTSTAGYSLGLNYGYTNGILQQVSDANSSTIFWQNSAMNPRGQVTQETLGNGIVTTRAFDAVTGWVSSIQSGKGGAGSAVQNQSYLFDYMGNVTQRQDNNQGLTENFYYDTDYRLDHSTLNNTLNLQMTYDSGSPGPGNITARSDVAGGSAWTYDAVRKHAVTQAGTGGYAYTYDGNGNVTNRNGYAINWSSYNYPTSINGPNKNITLYYGPNRQYYEQVYDSGSAIEKTIYAGGLLEKVTTGSLVDWRHYIRVNNELVAIMSRKSSGTNVTHYMLSDHEGSVATITDSSAATTVSESFSAFGTRRNPNTWSGIPTCPDLCNIAAISREGYTGHDALGGVSMGLNHMNGRVQDAITGRFLSPDPTMPNSGNTQSFNRYSYVTNNPLSATDPSGFCPAKFDFRAAGTGTNCGGSADLAALAGTIFGGSDGFDNIAGPDLGALTDSLNATSSENLNSLSNSLPSSSNAETGSQAGSAAANWANTSGGQAQSDGSQVVPVALNQGVPVVLPNGQTVPDQFSPTGNLMSPVADLSEVVVTGHVIGDTYSSLLINPEASGGAIAYLGSAILGAVGQGGTYDYQRKGNRITGFIQYPQFRDVSNFNVGLVTQAAGLTLDETLSYAGDLAYWESSNYSPNQPYGLNPRTAAFITLGYSYGQSGAFGP